MTRAALTLLALACGVLGWRAGRHGITHLADCPPFCPCATGGTP